MPSTGRTIKQNLSLSRDGGRANSIGIELSFSIPSDVTEFSTTLSPEVSVRSTKGFRGSGSKLDWDQQTPTPQIRGRYDPSRSSGGGLVTMDKGDWAIVSRPAGGVDLSWRYRGSDPGFEEQYTVDGQGVITSDGSIAYLGPYDRYTMNEKAEQFELIIPDEAELWHDPAAILECLTAASSHLEIGPTNNRVLAIAAPAKQSNWGPSGTQFGDEGFWTLDNIRLAHPNNTWIHEYVHTRQQFESDDSMVWFVEGTANYFSAWMGVKQDLIEFEEFLSYFTGTTTPDAILAHPSTWETSQTKYTKGAIVTAAFAAELRSRTNGEVDLMAVHRELCNRDKEISYNDFCSIVSKMGVPRITGWLDRYVAGSNLPEPPRNADLYGLDDGGVQDSTEPNGSETSPSEESNTTSSDTESDPTAEKETTVDEEDAESTPPDDADKDSDEDSEPGEETQFEKPEVEEGNCPVCEASVDEDSTYCSNCGTAIRRTCFVCGAQAPGQDYCPTCGTELVSNCRVCGHKQQADRTYCEKCGTEQ